MLYSLSKGIVTSMIYVKLVLIAVKFEVSSYTTRDYFLILAWINSFHSPLIALVLIQDYH